MLKNFINHEVTPTKLSKEARLNFARTALLDWFVPKARNLPWRKPNSTIFEKIVTEILLQRTKAETVASITGSFFTRFSNWNSLAVAPIEEIQSHLKYLGLWRRRSVVLKNLSAEMIALGGIFPLSRSEIELLSGVGQYVANAIELFVHGKPLPLLDTNMARVVERVFGPRKMADIRYDPWLQQTCRDLVAGDNPVKTNWALIDVGSLICRPRNPRCEECPLLYCCQYYTQNRPDLLNH